MNVFITGITGAIGSALSNSLLKAGHTVSGVGSADGDVRTLTSARLPQDVDVIYHAACYAQTKKHIKDPLQVIDTCYIGTKNVLDIAKERKCKVVFLSSSDVTKSYSIDEDRDPYVSGKIAAESLCAIYRKMGVNVTIVRMNHVYGFDENDERVVSAFIKKCKSGEKPVVTSNKFINLIFLDDVMKNLVSMCDTNKDRLVYELYGESKTVSGLSNMISEIVLLKTHLKDGLEQMV